MRKHQITARPLRRFAVTTDSAHSLPVAPNRLAQDFRVDKPNTVWSGDITYCGQARAGCICPWSWTCIPGAWSAGRCSRRWNVP